MPEPIDSSSMISIPPLPLSVLRLAEMLTSGQTDIEGIAQVIKYDPVLTGSVIRWANSSWSLPQSPIQDVWDAVMRLGSENILKLAVGHHVIASMRKLCGGMDQSENTLWKHSVATALVIEKTKEIVPAAAFSPVAFTAAIMHDIGKILLGRQAGYQKIRDAIVQLRTEEGLEEIAAERRITRTDHVELGISIAAHWKIPESIVQVIAYHHQPNVKADPLVDLVYFANTLTKQIGLGTDGNEQTVEFDSQVMGRLNLVSEQREAIAVQTRTAFQETVKKWGG